MNNVVLDASAGVEIALRTPIGRRLRADLPAPVAVWVPDHFYAEATGVLRRHELNARFDGARIRVALDRLLATPTRRVSLKALIPDAWPTRHNLTVADALYVVLAHRLDVPLITTDQRLANSPGLTVTTITP